MNKVILMGRMTKDPELRYTSGNNTAVCSFTLAVDRRFARQGEERQADFISVTAWSKLGEFCKNYFQKGSKIIIVGRIQTRTWDDAEGKKHYVTEVVAEEAYFADSKKTDSFGSKPAGGFGGDQFGGGGGGGQSDGFYPMDDDDELPF